MALRLLGILTLVSILPTGEAFCQKGQGNLKELKRQIHIINLLNGLYLDKGQITFILKEARDLERMREELKMKAEDSLAEQEEALLALREELKQQKPKVSRSVAHKIHSSKIEMAKRRKEYLHALDAAIRRVKSKLTINQLYTIENFKPCLVPPKGPGRVGQAESDAGLERKLEYIRGLPEDKYNLEKEKITSQYLNHLSLIHPKIKDSDLTSMREELLAIMDEARSLSQVDFLLQKKELAKGLKNVLPQNNPVDLDSKISHFLLSSQIIPVLEEKWLKQ